MDYKLLIEFGYTTEKDHLKEYFERDIKKHGYSYYWGCVDAILEWKNNAIDKSELKFIFDQLDEALRTVEGSRPIFVPKYHEDYIAVLSHYFEPKFKVEAFIRGNHFNPPINLKGNQQQLAGVFKELKAMGVIIFPLSVEKTSEYIQNNFTCNGNQPRSIIRYLTGKTRINENNLLDIGI